MREKSLEFPKSLKEEVYKDQGGCCAECGEKLGNRLEIHHCIPISFLHTLKHPLVESGTIYEFKRFVKSKWNAVAFCHSCHTLADEVALKHGYFYGFDKPLGIPINLE